MRFYLSFWPGLPKPTVENHRFYIRGRSNPSQMSFLAWKIHILVDFGRQVL